MNKYRNIKTVVDEIKFDSKKEANRYQELKLLARKGIISNLTIQPKFVIIVNDIKVCTYIGDFQYINEDMITIVEDVKGIKTQIYRLKKKLVKAVYGIDIQEV